MKSKVSRPIFIQTLVVAGFCLVSSAFAIIGESPAQSDLRYGDAIQQGDDWKLYQKAGLNIRVHFYDGLTDRVTYQKYTRDKHGRVEGISFEEMAILLDSNSKGVEWNGLSKAYRADWGPRKMWTSKELPAQAYYDNAYYERQKSWTCKILPLQAYYDDENFVLTVSVTNEQSMKTFIKRPVRNDSEKLVNTFGL